MTIRILTSAATALILTACAETASTPTAVDPISQAIAGKTLTIEGASFFSATDGTITGNVGDEIYKGVWTVRDGKLCNQFNEPARFSDTACFDVTLGDGTILIGTRSGGDPILWTIVD